jgi:cell division protein ZapE
VHRLDSPQDYRLRQLTRAATYLTPLGTGSEQALAAHFERLAGHAVRETAPLQLFDRAIAVKTQADGVAWFEFSEICEGPRAADYIEIARALHRADFKRAAHGSRQRGCGAALRASGRRVLRSPRQLAAVGGGRSAVAVPGPAARVEFERTSSRRIEMQSAEYLAREHRP